MYRIKKANEKNSFHKESFSLAKVLSFTSPFLLSLLSTHLLHNYLRIEVSKHCCLPDLDVYKRQICDRPAIREILDSFGIPKNHVVYGMAALGYPAQEPKKNVEKIGEVAIVE